MLSGVANCEAYLDNVAVYSPDWDGHMETLTAVFQHFKDVSLTLNLAKCEFVRATITDFSKEVGQGQVCSQADKITAIADYPVPTTKCQLRHFLRLANYLCAFLLNFGRIVSPLTDILWGECYVLCCLL